MTLEEINALMQLLVRIPLTAPEALWVNNLLARLRAMAMQRLDEPKPA